MIINHSHKFVFVHVPKTAGTAVSTMLRSLSTYKDLEIGTGDLGQELQASYGQRYGLVKHAQAHRIRRVMGEEDWQGYFTFGFARNPFSRLLSIYHFLNSWDKLPEAAARELAQFDDFEDFVLGDIWAKTPGPSGIYRPQTSWLTSKGQPNKLIVDFVGRQEHLAEDMGKIADRIGGGIRFNTEQRANVTPSYRKKIQWTNRMINRVLDRYRHDFELLGYSTQPDA